MDRLDLASIILAILDDDEALMRQAFAEFVLREDGLDGPAYRGVAQELCMSLRKDRSIMPSYLCAKLRLPDGSTYARAVTAIH